MDGLSPLGGVEEGHAQALWPQGTCRGDRRWRGHMGKVTEPWGRFVFVFLHPPVLSGFCFSSFLPLLAWPNGESWDIWAGFGLSGISPVGTDL